MSSRRHRELKRWERVVLELVWAVCWLVGHLPHFVLYRMLSPTLRFLIYRVVKYRREVVDENLDRCFPHKSEAERRKIRDDFYTIFAEIMVSTVALTNKKTFQRSFTTIGEKREDSSGRAIDIRELTRDRSWVALTAHFGLWEYLLVWTRFADQRVVAVYHQLGSRIFDELFKRLRGHHYKVTPVSSKETIRFAVRNGDRYQGESYVLGLIADQNPPFMPDSHWFSFLDQDTIFFEGGEKLALRMRMPVYYVFQRRTAPGCYEFCYEPIWDGVEEVEPIEITRRYVVALEAQIRETPHMWLWSHRRWKTRRGAKARWSDAIKQE